MDGLYRKDGLPDRRRIKRAAKRACAICKTEFWAIKDFKTRKQKYCSKKCWEVRGKYRKLECQRCGKVGLGIFGKNYCSRDCAFVDKIGVKASAWKGIEAGYSAIHKWVYKHFGKATPPCEHCHTDPGIGRDGRSKMQWANISGEYKRTREDWLRLCPPCHKKYDF